MQDTIGLPTTVLTDTGYASADAVAALQATIEPLVASGRTQPQRPYDIRPHSRRKPRGGSTNPGASP